MKSKLDRNRRRTAVTHKPALAYLVEWRANQKGRRALVFRLSNALVRVCAEKGVPVRLCPQTKTRLFPVDVANEFMMKVGASWVKRPQRHIVGLILPAFVAVLSARLAAAEEVFRWLCSRQSAG